MVTNESMQNDDHDGHSMWRQGRRVADLSRPLAEGSAFVFDHTGCIGSCRAVFDAYLRGGLTEPEMSAVEVHQSRCRKCHNTLFALLGEFEDSLVGTSQEDTEDSSGSEGGDEDEEPAFDRESVTESERAVQAGGEPRFCW
ncbi:MAG: hypothetical protein KF745_12885 [Phycisphaeraceae bacterium]|nr:hypothetical protein [Phycisphaeraceae bacterium]